MIEIFINKWLPKIEAALLRYYPESNIYPSKVYDSMKYTLFSGGKRIRPILMLCIGETFNGYLDNIMPFACAIEFIHTSSLILDDLPCMDNAKLRRGKPANHLVYGEDIAILAAIGLLNKAFSIIAEEKNNIKAEKLLDIQASLTNAISIKGLIGGQTIDLLSKSKKIDLQTVQYIHLHKTASLFIAAAEISAMLCSLEENQIKLISEYAKNIGLAFQISDDLNDLLSNEKSLGKDVKKDLDSTTFISYFGVDGSINLMNQLIEEAKEKLSLFRDRKVNLLEDLANRIKIVIS